MKTLEEVKKTVEGYLEMLKRLMENERLTLKEAKTGDKYNYHGVYVITRPDNDEVVYAGKTTTGSTGIKRRIEAHLRISKIGKSNLKAFLKKHRDYPQNPKEYYVRGIEIEDPRERGLFECFLISVLNPPFNRIMK
jgi:hypothetical protein